MDVPLSVRFTATERRERGAARWALIDNDRWSEPSLDDPRTALRVIDRAPKPRWPLEQALKLAQRDAETFSIPTIYVQEDAHAHRP